MRRGAVVFTVFVIAGIIGAQAAPAAKKKKGPVPADPAGLALNILPHGQGGSRPHAPAQAQMYNAPYRAVRQGQPRRTSSQLQVRGARDRHGRARHRSSPSPTRA